MKQPRGGHLSITDRQRNKRISSDRVIIENAFGRMQKLFGVMHMKYGWTREILDDIASICFSLTNFHLRLHPLREGDRTYYYGVLATVRKASDRMEKAGRIRQQRYRQKRDRIETVLAEDVMADEDEENEDTDNHISPVNVVDIDTVGGDGGSGNAKDDDEASDGSGGIIASVGLPPTIYNNSDTDSVDNFPME